jgi:hypothetical protein
MRYSTFVIILSSLSAPVWATSSSTGCPAQKLSLPPQGDPLQPFQGACSRPSPQQLQFSAPSLPGGSLSKTLPAGASSEPVSFKEFFLENGEKFSPESPQPYAAKGKERFPHNTRSASTN